MTADLPKPERLAEGIARLVARIIEMEGQAETAAHQTDRMTAILEDRDPDTVHRPRPRTQEEIAARAAELVQFALAPPEPEPAPRKRGRPRSPH